MELRKILFENYQLESLFNSGKLTYFYNAYIKKSEDLLAINDDVITIENIEFDERSGNDFITNIRNNSSPIVIRNCVFKKKVTISGTGMTNFTVDNTIFEDGLILKFNCNSLSIFNCSTRFVLDFEGDISNIFDIQACSFISLTLNGTQNAPVKITDVTVLDNTILKGALNQTIDFLRFNSRQLSLKLANAQKNFVVGHSNIEEITFAKNNFHREFIILHSKITKINFSNAKFTGNLLIQSSEFTDSTIFNLDEANWNVTISEGAFFNNLSILGTLGIESKMVITNCNFKGFAFENFINSGSLKLSNLFFDNISSFKLLHSNLGNAEIHNCDFMKSQFEFNKSQITDIFISETDFPQEVYKGGAINYVQGKLAFGQLQTVFQKQGDTVRSYEYLSREIKCYYSGLNWMSKNLFTKLNLFLSWISNDFGRNWIRGFIFSFGIGFMFYYFLLVSTNEFSIGIPNRVDWNFTSSFLKFMNPLRHFETENLFLVNENVKLSITLSNWSYVWDFLGRIFVAYGYFQTIQAFRKFGRK